MCADKTIYKITYADWTVSEQTDDEMSQFQAGYIFEELSDEFHSFFGNEFELTGYELNSDNIKNLNALKWRYRKSVILVVISVISFLYSTTVISRRRELAPLLYGGILAVLLTAVRAALIFFARHGVRAGIRDMILSKDYGYFSQGDILGSILPPDYARYMGLLYLGWVVVLILVLLIIRRLIIFAGRPHKY
jgi:hypothetical protein